jgi:iron-sulfur cluster repair protein YtfE (RIC family)
LVSAQHLKKAADRDAVARRHAVAEFVDAWDTEIAAHFADEERVLLPLLDAADGSRLRQEHFELNELSDAARAERRQVDPDASILRQLGDALEKHIRWEERQLFGRLQMSLSEMQLAALERETAAIENTRHRRAGRRVAQRDDHSPSHRVPSPRVDA